MENTEERNMASKSREAIPLNVMSLQSKIQCYVASRMTQFSICFYKNLRVSVYCNLQECNVFRDFL